MTNKKWYADRLTENYYRIINDELCACPILIDGSRGSDEEICSVDFENIDEREYAEEMQLLLSYL